MNELMTDILLAEYDGIIADIGVNAPDDQIIHALVKRGDWTVDGARAVVTLAREHGSFVLRNALALSAALGIEDGVMRR